MSPTPIDPIAGLTTAEKYVAGLLGGYFETFDAGTDRTKVRGIESQIEYNGTVINQKGTQDAVVITSIDGLSDADVRDSREVNPGYDGETAFNSFYGGRTIVLNGFVRAGTLEKLRDMQEGLKSTFSILDEAPLVFKGVSADKDLQIYCRKTQPITMSEVQQGFEYKRDFQITLRASDFRFTTSLNREYSWEWDYKEAVLTSSIAPSMYLRLDDYGGPAGTYADSSPNNRVGTSSGTSIPSGVLGGAVLGADWSRDFDGTNDYISTQYMPFASGATVRTYEAWIYRDTNTTEDTIISSSNTASNNAFTIKMLANTDTLSVALNDVAGNRNFTSTGIGTETWRHVVVVVDCVNDIIRLYVDGVLAGTGTSTGIRTGITETYSASPGNLVIGAKGTSTNYFDGKIAEVAVYEDELTSIDVLAHFRARYRYFSGEVSLGSVFNVGNYLADTIIKIEGPVSASGASGNGVIIRNNANSTNSSSINVNNYSNTAAYEIEGSPLQSTISIANNNESIINAKVEDLSSPYEVIASDKFMLINAKDRTARVYDSVTESFEDNAFDQVDKNSKWIKLAPGNNPLTIECTFNSAPKVTIYFRDTFI